MEKRKMSRIVSVRASIFQQEPLVFVYCLWSFSFHPLAFDLWLNMQTENENSQHWRWHWQWPNRKGRILLEIFTQIITSMNHWIISMCVWNRLAIVCSCVTEWMATVMLYSEIYVINIYSPIHITDTDCCGHLLKWDFYVHVQCSCLDHTYIHTYTDTPTNESTSFPTNDSEYFYEFICNDYMHTNVLVILRLSWFIQ